MREAAELLEAAEREAGRALARLPHIDLRAFRALLGGVETALAGEPVAGLEEAVASMDRWAKRLFGATCSGARRGRGVGPVGALSAAARCLSMLAGYLSSSRCSAGPGDDPLAVRLCMAADYAFRVMEREGLLSTEVPEVVLEDWAPERRGPWVAIATGAHRARRSVLDQLSARVEGRRVVLDLDDGKQAVLDLDGGTVEVRNVAARAAPSVRAGLERAAGLSCSVARRGRRADVRCAGLREGALDDAVAAAALAANVERRLLWYSDQLGEEDAGRLTRALERAVRAALGGVA